MYIFNGKMIRVFLREMLYNWFLEKSKMYIYLYLMYTFSKAFYELKDRLLTLYEEREAIAIAHLVLQNVTGLDKIQRLVQKDKIFSDSQQLLFGNFLSGLLLGKPLQYLIGSAYFLDREFIVDENVLIPRPETEELVHWILDDFKILKENKEYTDSFFSILDIGTGSGCIPVSIKLQCPEVELYACDISNGALTVARKNAAKLSANVHFFEMDILNPEQNSTSNQYDIIVSNPPYIPFNEKKNLDKNVRDYEPSIALFVPESDPLKFYKAIACFGRKNLKSNGRIYCELEYRRAEECKKLFEGLGYKKVEIRKDMHGNWRMIRADFC